MATKKTSKKKPPSEKGKIAIDYVKARISFVSFMQMAFVAKQLSERQLQGEPTDAAS